MNQYEHAEYLTKRELAEMLRVSTRTVSNYVRTGAIPDPVKIGRRALWARVALLAFIHAQQMAGRP